MRNEIAGIGKSLTRPAYRNMLWIIGRSNEPLSSTDVISQFGSKYGYEMLKELCPTEYSKGEFLFKWEEVIANSDNGRYKRKLVQRLNNIFSINWYTGEQQDDLNNKNILRFGMEKANDHSELLLLYQNDDKMIVIQLDSNKVNGDNNARIDLMTIFHKTRDPLQDGDTESHRLIVEHDKKSNKRRLYVRRHNPATLRYLDITLKPNIEKLISAKRKQVIDAAVNLRKEIGDHSNPKISDIGLAEYFPDIASMINNRENWRYTLNLRGLLLYLFSWSQSTDNRQRIRKISEVISNPALIEKIPFLMHWQYFERTGFTIFDLLLSLSIEYQNQMHIDAEEDNYLLRRITERFFIEVENHFHRVSQNPVYLIKKKIGIQEYDKILEKRNEYRQSLIRFQRQWINKQLKVLDYFDS